MKDQVFVTREAGQDVWKCTVNGQVVKADFNSKGAALAGIEVERRRAQRRSK